MPSSPQRGEVGRVDISPYLCKAGLTNNAIYAVRGQQLLQAISLGLLVTVHHDIKTLGD